MAYDLIFGQTKHDWTKKGSSVLSDLFGMAETRVVGEAMAVKERVVDRAVGLAGMAAFLGGALYLGYTGRKSVKGK